MSETRKIFTYLRIARQAPLWMTSQFIRGSDDVSPATRALLIGGCRFFQIEALHLLLIAEEQPAPGDYRHCPTTSAAKRPGLRFWSASLRTGFEKKELAVLTEDEQEIVDAQQRSLVDARPRPHHFAGAQVHAGQARIIDAEEILAAADRTGEMTAHLLAGVDFLCLETAVGGRLDFQQSAASAIPGGNEYVMEHFIAAARLKDHGRGGVNVIAGGPREAPARLTVGRPHGNKGPAHEKEDLPCIADGDGDGRAVACRLVELFPHELAGHFIECGEGITVGSAGASENEITIDQRRKSDAPFRRQSAKFVKQINLPARIAVGCVQTEQLAIAADGVDAVAVQGRRRTRPRIIAHMGAALVGIAPHFFAVLDAPTTNDFFIALLKQRVKEIVFEGERGIAQTDGLLPEQGQSFLGPIGREIGHLNNAIAMRSAPLRPARRLRRRLVLDENRLRQLGAEVGIYL